MSRLRKCAELDFSGNNPFWMKNEGFGLTLYFPAFRPEKSFYQNECMGTDKLVFGILGDDIPMSFIVSMMEQGKVEGHLKAGKSWIRPECTPSGRIIMAVGIGQFIPPNEGDRKTAWSVTQIAYNHSRDWYNRKVKELWEQAKMAAQYFASAPERTSEEDIINVQVIEPEKIEA